VKYKLEGGRCYLSQGGYVFIGICLFVCFSLLMAGLHKNYLTDCHKILWKGGIWATEQTDPVPLKLQPYGAIEILLLLLLCPRPIGQRH